MIRYLYIEELGWVVGVEAVMGSQLDLIRDIFDWDVCLRLVLVLVLGAFSFRLITNQNFSIMKKIIADSLESSFMNLSNDEIWGGNSSEHKIAEKVEHNASRSPVATDKNLDYRQEDLSHGEIMAPSMPDLEQASPFKKPQEVPSTVKSSEQKALAENLEKEKQFSSKPVFEKSFGDLESKGIKKVRQNSKKLKTEPPKVEVFENEAGFDDLKIDVQGIKSPVLKKMIKELREKE